MAVVLEFSRQNYQQGTGGPFAAGVFETESGKLISIGVNRVVPMSCSSAHAEIMALSLAQQRLNTYDLGGTERADHQLVVNWCPCAMCFGAVFWSGIRSLVIAGSGLLLEEITGFDEGPIHPDWPTELDKRGITLHEDILHDQAVALFRDFSASGQLVYNARQGSACSRAT
ncbi:MAG: CMP deaminase [Desulfobulbus propionicus]|nr:MAG: CMP deaminase [Desulfobulbus propionicus]